MSEVAALEATRVDLLGSCAAAGCLELAGTMRAKLDTPKYRENVSLLAVPASLEEWRAEHRTARKRADRCGRLGYSFAEIDRSLFDDDIHEINTSLSARQGRPMEAGYRSWRRHGRLPEYPCSRHAIRTYGVLQGDRLRAYLTLYRVHELALVSMILGHGAHLADDVMYLLFAGVVADQAGAGGVFYYNRHDSGTEGLRYYKERLGFAAGEVEWQL